VPGFVIPFAFAAHPGLILQEGLLPVFTVIVPAAFGVLALAAAGGGYAFGPLPMLLRVLMFIAGPMLISPDLTTDLIGAAILLAVMGYQLWRRSKTSSSETPPRALGPLAGDEARRD
jgi:TRAP-type uncharacterized transport system fused permease subunit